MIQLRDEGSLFKFSTFFLLLFALAGFVQPLRAQTAQEITSEQIALTPQLVERYIASHRALLDFLKRPEVMAKIDDTSPIVDRISYALAKAELKGEVERILQSHQFASLADWAKAAYTAGLAYGYIDGEGDGFSLETEKKTALEAVGNDKTLNPEQRAQAIKDVEVQFEVLKNFMPLAGNVAVVKPYAAQLKPLILGHD